MFSSPSSAFAASDRPTTPSSVLSIKRKAGANEEHSSGRSSPAGFGSPARKVCLPLLLLMGAASPGRRAGSAFGFLGAPRPATPHATIQTLKSSARLHSTHVCRRSIYLVGHPLPLHRRRSVLRALSAAPSPRQPLPPTRRPSSPAANPRPAPATATLAEWTSTTLALRQRRGTSERPFTRTTSPGHSARRPSPLVAAT